MGEVTALDLFEALCEAESSEVESELARHPARIAERVRALLRADRSDGRLEATDVQWSVAAGLPPLEEPAVTPPPAVVGGYRVVRPLGEGGMGRVFEAEQASPRRRVALKILRASGENAVQAALEEAQALVRVRHPQIPHVVEVGVDQGLVFLVMELVEGVPLRSWAEGRSRDAILGRFIEVVRTVAAIHRVGLVHRDLKPANILVDPGGETWVVDFGLAYEHGSAGPAAGTLPYLAPEVLDGRPSTTEGDVYALGVVLFELLCGRHPHAAARIPTLAAERAVRHGPAPTLPGPRDLSAVLSKALTVEDRYPSAEELLRDLEAVRDGRPTRALPPSRVGRVAMWLGRNRRLVWVGAGSAGLVVAALGLGSMVVELQQARVENARHERADVRLSNLRTHLEPLYERGDMSAATDLLQGFVDHPDARGTPAVSDAWMHHHDQLLARGETEQGWSYLSRAYLAAAPERRREIRGIIASGLERDRRWHALLRLLDQDVPAAALERRGTVLVALRRFEEALPHVAPDLAGILSSWVGARRFDRRPLRARSTRIDGRDLVALFEQDAGRISLVHTDQDLSTWVEHPLPPVHLQQGNPILADAQDLLLLGFDPDTQGPVRMWRVGEAITEAGVLPIEGGFLGGAAVPEAQGDPYGFFLGTVYPGRQFWSADLSAQTAHPLDLVGGSDIEDVQSMDLDRDGVDEVVVTTGRWAGNEILVLRRSGAGLELSQRLRFRGHPRFAELDRGDTRLLVVATGDTTVGPAGSSRLEKGVHLFRIDGNGSLQLLHHSPGIFQEGMNIQSVLSADLDGDGDDEALINVEGSPPHLVVVTLTDPHVPAFAHVAGLVALEATDLDEDAAEEVLARMVDDDHHLWVLGLQDGDAPRVFEPAPDGPPQLIGASVDGMDLLELGLAVEVANAIRWIDRDASPEHADQLAFAGAILHQEGRLSDATRLYDAALATSFADPALHEARARAVHANHLDGPAPVLLDPSSGLPPEVRVLNGSVLRVGQGWKVDAVGGDGRVLDLELEVGDEGVGVAVTMEIDLLEPGVELGFELSSPAGEPVQLLATRGWGGDKKTDRSTVCKSERPTRESREYGDLRVEPRPPTRVTLRGDRRRGEQLCELRRNGEHARFEAWAAPSIPKGRYTLALRVSGGPGYQAARARATILGLEIRGAALVRGRPVDPVQRPWALGNLEVALEHATDPMSRATLLVHLGDREAALGLLESLDPDAPDVRAVLISGLKRAPGAWLPLLHDWSPEHLPELYAEAWANALSSHRPASVQASIEHPYVDDFLPSSPRLTEVLFYRANLLAETGRSARAQRVLSRILPYASRELAIEIHVRLARLALANGDVGTARAWCDEARANDRGHRIGDLIADDRDIARACGEP